VAIPPNRKADEDLRKYRKHSIYIHVRAYANPCCQLFPHVKYVLDKFRHKLPKDDLKKFGKEVNKKLVASDYKHNRVSDPTAPLTAKQERNIKSYVKEFLEKAVAKYKERESRRATRQAHQPTNGNEELIGADPGSSAAQTPQGTPPGMDDTAMPEALDDPDDVDMSDGEEDVSMLKRKRDEETLETPSLTPSDGPSIKKVKETASDEPSPPPPPPPPPDAAMESEMSEEQKALREQEEALMRENEEAQRLEDEAARDKAHLGLEAPGHESLPQATNGSILINGSGE
jgi:histone-lysine N-methyltransferase SETD2